MSLVCSNWTLQAPRTVRGTYRDLQPSVVAPPGRIGAGRGEIQTDRLARRHRGVHRAGRRKAGGDDRADLPTWRGGVPSAPLAAASDGPDTLRDIPRHYETIGRFRRVDGLATSPSAFGHGDAEAAVQLVGEHFLRGHHAVPDGIRDEVSDPDLGIPFPRTLGMGRGSASAAVVPDGWIETIWRRNPYTITLRVTEAWRAARATEAKHRRSRT